MEKGGKVFLKVIIADSENVKKEYFFYGAIENTDGNQISIKGKMLLGEHEMIYTASKRSVEEIISVPLITLAELKIKTKHCQSEGKTK